MCGGLVERFLFYLQVVKARFFSFVEAFPGNYSKILGDIECVFYLGIGVAEV